VEFEYKVEDESEMLGNTHAFEEFKQIFDRFDQQAAKMSLAAQDSSMGVVFAPTDDANGAGDDEN